ncbi:MAG: EamA family transporter, partial [Proteobacteria bacterium]
MGLQATVRLCCVCLIRWMKRWVGVTLADSACHGRQHVDAARLHPLILLMNHPNTPIRPLRKALPLVVVLTILWGTNWVLFPLAVQEVSVWTFRAICLLGAGLLSLGIARGRGLSLHVPRSQRPTLVTAALVYLVVWNVGSTYAAVLIPSGQAAVLGFTMPLWATILSWLVFGEKPSLRLVGSVALAGCGVACLAYAGRHSYAAAPLGFLLGLAAGLGWACG